MSKNSSVIYYQENKEKPKKSFRRYRSLSKEEKIESDNMVVNDRKSTRR